MNSTKKIPFLKAMTTTRHLCLLASLLGSQAFAQDSTTGKPAPHPGSEDRFESRNLEGWTIYINRDVPKQHPAQLAKTLNHLKWELYQTKLAAPPPAVTNMQEKNAIWIEHKEGVDLSYHPERSWLIDQGYTIPRDPESFMSLSVATHVGDSYRHPFVVFHELAHGYDFHFIGSGKDYGNPECQTNYKLHMIDHFIAGQGRQQLHEVPIWLEAGQPGPYVRYCGSKEQLAGETANPDKFGAVEVRDPQRMMDWALLQQSDLLHDLALAYYDRHAATKPAGLGGAIQNAYEQASKTGKYSSVLRFDGQHVPHPAMTSEKEYFANMMESYFLANDHYPGVENFHGGIGL